MFIEVPSLALFKKKIPLKYGVPKEGKISIQLYDVSGRRIKTIIHGKAFPGIYESYLDIKEIGSGVYFILYRMEEKRISKKLVIIQ